MTTEIQDTCQVLFRHVPKDVRAKFRSECALLNVPMSCIHIEFMRNADADFIKELRDSYYARKGV